ncbi:hypothetical protein ACI8AC_23640 [Geodermatophilus sp. SYSU D00758]
MTATHVSSSASATAPDVTQLESHAARGPAVADLRTFVAMLHQGDIRREDRELQQLKALEQHAEALREIRKYLQFFYVLAIIWLVSVGIGLLILIAQIADGDLPQ